MELYPAIDLFGGKAVRLLHGDYAQMTVYSDQPVAVAHDFAACGARGIISEPYTDYKAIARKHKDCFIAGEGDNRVLVRNDPAEIRAMVESMAETAQMSGGYMMCIGNHIPWNVPADAIKRYIDLSRELAKR